LLNTEQFVALNVLWISCCYFNGTVDGYLKGELGDCK